MKVALFGATGLTGRSVLRQALDRGHEVTALVRRPQALDVSHPRLQLVAGDALDGKAVGAVVHGHDAVIQALGVGGKGDGKPSTLVSDATRLIVDAMRAHGVRRLVCMSNVGAGDSWSTSPWLFRAVVLPLFLSWLKPIIDDKNRMEPLVTASGLDWTLVRLPAIVDKPATGRFRVSFDGKRLGFSITVDDAAAFLVDQLQDQSLVAKAPSVSNG